ncbi:hypothetical protein AB0C51_15820 [Streptomyces pathocidini]|uniref:hypothetical protein n=1 Tax=Streptomyces pathocidini TaxID=1650571 RepID=UPI0033C54B58
MMLLLGARRLCSRNRFARAQDLSESLQELCCAFLLVSASLLVGEFLTGIHQFRITGSGVRRGWLV